MGDVLGETVGVSIRFVSKFNEKTRVKYMTEGILLREMLADPLLSEYAVIMIDEAHERNTLTDCTMGLLKKIAKKRDNLKIIISSATVDAELFKDFFNFTTKTKKDSSIILTVEGRMYENEIFYLDGKIFIEISSTFSLNHFISFVDPCPDYIKGTVETILKIHKKEKQGDILAFLTGQDEVHQCISILKEYIETAGINDEELKILPMHGSLTHHDQLKVFFSVPRGVRKVILATNIAETSVTIPGIVFVIDCGFVKLKWFSAQSQTESLVVVPSSKAGCRQRAGRAGRIRNGKVFRLCTEEDFKQLPDQTPPEMRRTDLCSTILHLKALGVDNILRFNFPSPPPAKNMLSSVETLFALDALDEDGNLTSKIGYFMAEMPINPMMAKMLYMASEMGCSEEILSIIAMLQVQNVFSKPMSGQASINARIARRNFEVSEGDLITLLNVYTAFVKNGCTKEFCGRYFLLYRNLKRAHEIRGQLSSLISHQFKMKLKSCGSDISILSRCITFGYFPYAAYLHHSGVYRTVRGETELSIHPMSCLYTEKQPQWIVFCEVLHTTKLFIKDITVIKQDWLTEIAPHYYHKTTVRQFDY